MLVAGGVVSCEVASSPHNGLRVGSLLSEARSALPTGSSREQVEAWLDARGFRFQTVHGKGGEFARYLVRMRNGSWLRPDASFWVAIDFDPAERLSGISGRQD